MKKRNVLAPIFLLVLVFLVFLIRRWNEPQRREVFDRHPPKLAFTEYSLCRMDCRQIAKTEIKEIMQKGVINFNKSNRLGRPCPVFALQGRTESGKYLRVIFSQCPAQTNVVTVYNLEKKDSCFCPGGHKRERN